MFPLPGLLVSERTSPNVETPVAGKFSEPKWLFWGGAKKESQKIVSTGKCGFESTKIVEEL